MKCQLFLVLFFVGTDCARSEEPVGYTYQAVSPTLVQAESQVGSGSSLAVQFTNAQSAGDLNVVAVAWNTTVGSVSTVKDSSGNAYALAVGPTSSPAAIASLYYASNIKAAAAGANTVTVKLSGAEQGFDVRIAEFSGAASLDVAVGSTANGDTLASPPLTTASSGELLVGAGYVSCCVNAPGAGYTEAVNSGDCNDLEYRVAGSAGAYNATWVTCDGTSWGLGQLAAFRASAVADAGADARADSSDATSEAAQDAADAASDANDSASDVVQDSTIDVADAAVDAVSDVSAETGGDATVDAGGDGGQACYPLKASSNGRYLTCQDGVTPFLLLGDSPHSLLANLDTQTMTTYMSDRHSRGFNAILVQVLCNDYTGGNPNGTTYDGVAPFTSGSSPADYDLSTPNPAYFSRLDALVRLAANYGLVVFLDPIDTGGWLTTLQNNGATKAHAYGAFLGGRYKSSPNLVWESGNDFQSWTSDADNNLVYQVMTGIASADANHLQTVELNYNASYSNQDALLSAVSNLDAVYTYFETYDWMLQAYRGSPTLPAFLTEGNYEYENNDNQFPGTTGAFILREQAYWTMTSGGTGQLYGNHYTWSFNGPLGDPAWQMYLGSPGTVELQYWTKLFGGFSWWTLVPDTNHQVVTAGYGTYLGSKGNLSAADYVTTAWNPDGSLAVAYDVAGASLTVALSAFRGQVTAQWYDPSAGAYVATGSWPNTGSHAFSTPGANHDGDRDWVLLLRVN